MNKISPKMQRPIIFSTEMVKKAILEGRKTQTRRVMKPQPSEDVKWENFGYSALTPENNIEGRGGFTQYGYGAKFFKMPYGQPGDQLWVRETWATSRALNNCKPRNLQSGAPIEYRAGGSNLHDTEGLTQRGKWRPSIFMPKWAARIWLEITDVRVERLQEISPEDARAEGWPVFGVELFPAINCEFKTVKWFKALWDSLNEKRGYGWDVNPYVWVITFKKVGDSK